MPQDLISPNYHVILIHYPLGLLTVGVLAEVIGLLCFRPRFSPAVGTASTSTLRTAGRWMILIGALMSVPTAFAGVYALRDVVLPGDQIVVDMAWYQVLQANEWSGAQWHFIFYHVLINSIAAGTLALVALVFLASSDRGRRWLHWPGLLLVLAGVGLMVVGAWFGGEMVYRYGIAVHDTPPAGDAIGAYPVSYYLPPLQWHILLASTAATLALLALAVTVRRWQPAATVQPRPAMPRTDTTGEPTAIEPRPGAVRVGERVRGVPWLWTLASLVALAAAVFGIWSVWTEFSVDALRQNLRTLGNLDHLRLLLHTIFGVSLIVLPLVLAVWLRGRPRATVMRGLALALVPVLLGLQIWMGVLMLFDSHRGPLIGFRSPSPTASGVAAPADEHEHADADSAPADTAPRVTMTDDLRYQPAEITVPVNTTVRWENTSSIVHTVTADEELANDPAHVHLPEGAEPFNSGDMAPGETFEHTFTVPGRYQYFCIPHEAAGMIGTVHVEPAGK